MYNLELLNELTYLNLKNNSIESIQSIENLTKLIYLDLQMNKLKIIKQNELNKLINIEELNLKNNLIETIEQYSFYSNILLKTLDLSNNKIFKIEANYFNGLNSLWSLNLLNNSLVIIDKLGFNSLSDIKKYIHNNGIDDWEELRSELKDLMNESKYNGKNVKLNSPFKTSGKLKKFAVYVKEPSGDIKMVKFGDPNNKPETKKNFRVRHKCDTKHDKTKAVYCACNISKYRKKLGIKS